MGTRAGLLAGALLSMVGAAASAQEVTRCPQPLPQVVAQKRDAILAAARARDYAGLKNLIPDGEFVYSFGEGSDAIGYWRKSAKDNVDIAKLMVAIFEMRCTYSKGGGEGNFYNWPSAADIEWAKLDAQERAALERLYGKTIDQYWLEGRARGYYVGWRGAIDEQGRWRSFVAGD